MFETFENLAAPHNNPNTSIIDDNITYKTGMNIVEQVPACDTDCDSNKIQLKQTSDARKSSVEKRCAHNGVKQRKRKKCKQTGRRTGGYPTTRYMTNEEWREAKAAAYAIVNAGYRWSILLTIRPSEEMTDRQKQDRIQKVLSRVAGALRRHGTPYIAMRTYEKKRGGGSLHGHALIYVPKELYGVIERIVDRFDRRAKQKSDEDISVEIHAKVIGGSPDDLRNSILYTLKEHEWAGPGYDGSGTTRKFYEKGDPITGRRIGYSKDAMTILSEYSASLPDSARGLFAQSSGKSSSG